MAEADIPDEVKRFLTEHIDTLFQLEVLLLLHANRDVAWSAERIDRELRTGLEIVRKLLAIFEDKGFVSVIEGHEVTYRYSPATKELDHSVNLLAITYKERRVKVTSFIYSSPLENIRNFAEAFRIRKEK